MAGSMVMLDAAGRRRSPVTTPGYLAGRAPRDKGMQYPPDPPRPEEIIQVMRHAGQQRHGLRARALIAVLWRGGLRISEALALNETDVDPRRGSLLIRHGKGDRRREIGMDPFGFEQLAAWTAYRTLLPPGPLFCVIDGATAVGAGRPTPRAPSSASSRAPRRSQTPLRATSATPCPRRRARARRRRGQHHPAPARVVPGYLRTVAAKRSSFPVRVSFHTR